MMTEAAESMDVPLQEQSEFELKPIAIVQGEPFLRLPEDLYIPPDAMEVILETFAGPLDLLLYLIKRHNLDILNIPIAEITYQYLSYINLMRELRFELAAEYLLMAALLAEIKSRMLLPKPPGEEGEEEEDPRAELVRRLQEYERYKKAAEDLDALPQRGREIFMARALIPEWEIKQLVPEVELNVLLEAFRGVLKRAELFKSHKVERESLSIRARMTDILSRVSNNQFVEFVKLFTIEEGRLGVVVTFIAMLELLKQSLIEIVQAEAFSTIHIKAKVVTENE